jgi:hypothetical protein
MNWGHLVARMQCLAFRASLKFHQGIAREATSGPGGCQRLGKLTEPVC